MSGLFVIDNKLAKHYLTVLRDKSTRPAAFREYMRRLGFVLGYEASKYVKWSSVAVETPLARAPGLKPESPLLIVGILGASIPLVQGVWDALPWAGLGLVAARRVESEGGVEVEIYYQRLPRELSDYVVFLGDPMLATGKTISKAIDILVSRGASEIVVLTVIASKPGVEYVRKKHPSVPIIAVEVDPELDDKYFIVPGLGDAGDRSLDQSLI